MILLMPEADDAIRQLRGATMRRQASRYAATLLMLAFTPAELLQARASIITLFTQPYYADALLLAIAITLIATHASAPCRLLRHMLLY